MAQQGAVLGNGLQLHLDGGAEYPGKIMICRNQHFGLATGTIGFAPGSIGIPAHPGVSPLDIVNRPVGASQYGKPTAVPPEAPASPRMEDLWAAFLGTTTADVRALGSSA
jgi:hypothetical protein